MDDVLVERSEAISDRIASCRGLYLRPSSATLQVFRTWKSKSDSPHKGGKYYCHASSTVEG